MGVAAEPEMHDRLAELRRHRLGRHDGAPGGFAGKARWLGKADARARVRPQAVGRDQSEAALVADAAAPMGRDGHAVAVSDEILHAHAELDGDVEMLRDGGHQHRLQVAAMDRPIGRAVALRSGLAERHAHDFAAARGVQDAHRRRRDDVRPQLLFEPQRDQHPRRIGRELDPRAGLLEPLGLFQDDDAKAVADQSERRGQAADAGAGHDDDARRGQGACS